MAFTPRFGGALHAHVHFHVKDGIERILSHLRLPLRPVVNEDDTTVLYDVTGEPVLDEAWDEAATDRRQRAPPDPWEGVDPPAPGA